MNPEKKVLLVEDIDISRITYANIIKHAGYAVDTVSSLDEAIAAIDRKTYQVAVVDIILAEDDVFNRDGLRVIEYLQELNEGTESVIISGQDEVDVAIEAFHKFGLVQYINKKRLEKSSDITSAVDKAFGKARIKQFGPFHSVSCVFSGKGNEMTWEHKCLALLKPSEGAAGFSKFLQGFIKPLTPLLPGKDSASPSAFDEGRQRVTAEFWSKGVGGAVRVLLAPARQAESALGEVASLGGGQGLIHRYEKANIVGLAFSAADLGRERFAQHLFDKA
jgi:ActR/RegA family two-component response regulator